MSESITSNLKLELERTNQALNRWLDTKVDHLESSDSSFKQHMEEMAFTISALKNNEQQLEEARSHNDSIKRQQKGDLEQFVKIAERLRLQNDEIEKKLGECHVEEEQKLHELEVNVKEHETLVKNLQQFMNDLTKGVEKYMALGLEFQKSEGECMKFIFTNIDPLSPSRPFYFIMHVDANDKYNIKDVSPAVDPEYIRRQVDVLNNDNEIGKFVFNMRRAFVKLVNRV